MHTTIALELCMGTMAQIIRPVWDEWDYGGDVNFLRKECYPILREMALFYAAYSKKGSDGFYHIIPSMEEERWGIYPEFARNKDVISSLCMFRWGLSRAADAAEFLGVDSDLSRQWREVSKQLLPYPTWKKPEGVIFAGMPDVEPRHLSRDHFGDAAAYPTILADEINLDSPQDQRDMMIRTVKTLPSGHTNGFYPVFPASGTYIIGSPIFDKATINLGNHKKFTIETINNSPENIYIQSIVLNVKNYESSFIRHQVIMNGGTMKIKMGNKPNFNFGKLQKDRQ